MSRFARRFPPARLRAGIVGFTCASVLALHSAFAQDAGGEEAPAPPDSAFQRKVRDDVDAAGPYDETAIRRLQRVEEYMAEERWDRALEMLSYTLDQDQGSLVRLADGRLVPLVGQVHRLLSELPADSLDLWRRQYEEVAQDRLQEGLQSGRRELVEQVATEFRLTDAGRRAVVRLARLHADRGQFALAARYLRSLEPNNLTIEARVRGVRTWIAVEDDKQAKKWLETIPPEDWRRLIPGAAGMETKDLLSHLKQQQQQTPVRTEWRHPFGGSTGTGLATSGEPLLLNRWTQPATQDINRQAEIARLNEMIQDQVNAIVPAAMPLAIGNQVFARMDGRVRAYDLGNGRLIWESTPEAADANAEGQHTMIFNGGRAVMMAGGAWQARSAQDLHPLADPLYRDGTLGLITADAERIYFVQPPNWGAFGRPQDIFVFRNGDRQLIGAGTNELHAYDLETGRPAWTRFGGIGGDLDLGAFERPLSGYFFFGPPVPVGDELYVIGEREGEIDLIALDPASGMKRWSRQIASAPRPISQQPVRQNWNAQVAESDGILVCPTTVGWLVAVDKVNRSLLWAHRYAPVDSSPIRGRNDGSLKPASLGQRWGPSVPIIVDGRVIFTPPEELRLVCVDLVTGEKQWPRRGKGNYRYVAGAADNRLIVVGERTIDGIDLATGNIQWSYRIPAEFGYPTGRGVLSEDQFLLPTTNAVLTIGTDGSLIDTVKLDEGQLPLGNLVMHKGALISLAVEGLSVYEERNHYLEQIEQVQADSAQPRRSRFLRAQLRFAEGQFEHAAATLDEIEPNPAESDPLAERIARLRWNVLTHLVQDDPGQHAARLGELRDLADTPAERLLVKRLEAGSLAAGDQIADAADRYLQLLSETPGTMIAADGPGHRQVRLDNWISGQLLDLWKQAQTDQRSQIEAVVQQCLATDMTAEQRARVIHAVSVLPFARGDLLELARQSAGQDRPGEAEISLLRLLDSPDAPLRGESLDALAKLAREHHLEADAAYWHSRQQAAHEEGGAKQKTHANPSPPFPATMATGHDWSRIDLEVAGNSLGRRREAAKDVEVFDSPLPFHQQFRLQVAAASERLLCPDIAGLTESRPIRQISVPLRSRQSQSRDMSAHAVGHVVVMSWGGLVQAVSLIDGRVLWSWTPDEPINEARHENPTAEPMRTARGFVVDDHVAGRFHGQTILATGAGYVLVEDSGRLTALDTMTGRPRWSRDRFSWEATFVCTTNYIFALSSRESDHDDQAFRAVDGHSVELPVGNLRPYLSKTIDTVGDCLLTLDGGESVEFFNVPFGGGTTLSLRDPASDEQLWSRDFAPNALFARAADGTIFVLTPDDGTLVGIDPATGQSRIIGKISTDTLNQRNEVYLLTDLHSVYVLVNRGRGTHTYFSSELQSIPANGELFAFDRRSGGQRWKEEIDDQRLLVQSFPHLPVLLFAAASQKNINNQTAWRAKLLVIDKSTGNTAIDDEVYVRSSPMLRHLAFDPQQGTIDIAFYSSRIHLTAAPMTEGSPSVEAPRP